MNAQQLQQISKKVIDVNTVKLRVSFKQSIDNDDFKFASKKEAIAIVQSLITNEVGNFDYVDEGEYKYVVFSEYVVAEVSEQDLAKYPQYALVSDIEPQIDGGTFSSVKRLK